MKTAFFVSVFYLSSHAMSTMNEQIVERQHIADEFIQAANNHDISIRLLIPACKIESDFRHYSRDKILTSSSGAIGICQIKPNTAKQIGCGDISQRRENIDCAARYMSMIKNRRCSMIPNGTASQHICMVGLYHDGIYKRGEFSRAGKIHIERFKKVYNTVWL